MAEIQTNTNKQGTPKKASKPDMTPLVDLGFLLITFFIYTTTFTKSNIVRFATPMKDQSDRLVSPVKTSNTITLILGENNRIFWYQTALERVSADDLHETDYSASGVRKAILEIKDKALDPKNWTVIIKPTNEATWGNTVDILDEMTITGSLKNAVVDLQETELKAYREKITL